MRICTSAPEKLLHFNRVTVQKCFFALFVWLLLTSQLWFHHTDTRHRTPCAIVLDENAQTMTTFFKAYRCSVCVCVSVCKSDHISSVCLLQFDIASVHRICNTASHIFTLDVSISAKRSNVQLQACVCVHVCVCVYLAAGSSKKKEKVSLIFMKLDKGVQRKPKQNPLNFGIDLNQGTDA